MGAEIDRRAEGGREFGYSIGEAVIGGCGHDHARAAGADLSHAIGDVVGLTAGAGQHQMGKLSPGHRREQPFGQLENRIVQIAGVGGESLHLPAYRLGYRRMAMSERGDVVVDVEVAAPFRIDQPHTFAAHNVQGMFVHQPIGRAEQGVSPLDHGRGGGVHVGTPGDIRVDHIQISGGAHWLILFVLRSAICRALQRGKDPPSSTELPRLWDCAS